MATFTTEIGTMKADGTCKIYIRLTHDRVIKRIPTGIHVNKSDLTRGGKIKNVIILNKCADIINMCREFCNGKGFDIANMTADELRSRLETYLAGGERFRLDFFAYANEKIGSMSRGTGGLYTSTMRAVKRYIRREFLDISEINSSFLKGFERFISNEPSQRGGNRNASRSYEPQKKGERAVSLYMSHLRHLHNMAKDDYNNEDMGIIRIPYSPFKVYKVKPTYSTRKRAISIDMIQKIIDFPYERERKGVDWRRLNVAKDCFLLSFALMGMNSADLFYCKKCKNVLVYRRRKTESRRSDFAEMRVKIESVIVRLMEEYADMERMFNFHTHYKDEHALNKAINIGLKEIGKKLGLENLEFYAARHSWATIACSSLVGIDKQTVHEALNHVDEKMKVTDIYIDRDWNNVWNANKKVLALFDWSSIG
ncbi:MAG: site-specific integrase [Tannerella sp.]|jgi:integrase|nr:site-specific integrase [Tannerella sp.]